MLCGCEYESAALRTSRSPPQWLAGVRGAFLLYILAAAHAWLVPGHLHACICWYGDATSVCSPGLLLDEITPELVGRVLGSGPSAEARWEHLAGDAAACEAIKTSVMQHHMLVDMFFLGLGLGF